MRLKEKAVAGLRHLFLLLEKSERVNLCPSDAYIRRRIIAE